MPAQMGEQLFAATSTYPAGQNWLQVVRPPTLQRFCVEHPSPGPAQSPQSRLVPQPSSICPQSAASAAQLVGVHPHTFETPPPPQLSPVGHAPQSRVLPQPSLIVPQFLPCAAHEVGTQAAAPHWLAPAPPQL
jgi:hypothetical protein